MKKALLIVLVLMNMMVLSGQLWPEGAPPFAKTVNIVFLVSSLVYFSVLLLRKGK
jgi:hypothetical protein